MMPLATEMSSAGTWLTSPSPTLSTEYRAIASPIGRPICRTPIAKPPMRLIVTMMMPAIASPLTNLLAPSIEPKKSASRATSRRRCLACVVVDQPAVEVGVDGHLLAGHRVEGEAGRDLRDTSGTRGDDDELHDHQDEEDDEADDEAAADDDVAEGLDHLAGATRA